MYVLGSDITIGSFRFSGVHEVHVWHSINTVEEKATIELPLIAYVERDGSVNVATTNTLFTDGQPVHINLGYNGDLNSEFTGFVKRRSTGLKVVVECEGYCRQLRLNVHINANFSKAKTSAKKLLELACKGTDIAVDCPVDFALQGIRVVDANGLQIVDYIKAASDHTLSIFFIEPKKLWCGLIYNVYATDKTNAWGFPTIDYELGYNCLKDNGLKERIPSEPVQVKYSGKLANGNAIETDSKNKAAKSKLKNLLAHVPDEATMKKFAQEKEYKLNYTGYEGYLTGFLQPYCAPGMDAHIVNRNLPELNGKYLIEGVEVTFGVNGARRKLTIGPRVGFDS